MFRDPVVTRSQRGGKSLLSSLGRCTVTFDTLILRAMTIHKAQGLTLERVRVNVDGAFELGQVYVAVSRVTSLEGLEIVGFDKRK
jgi:hypothetical protein